MFLIRRRRLEAVEGSDATWGRTKGNVGFYRDLMGLYRDLMGFYRDLMGFYRDFMGFRWILWDLDRLDGI